MHDLYELTDLSVIPKTRYSVWINPCSVSTDLSFNVVHVLYTAVADQQSRLMHVTVFFRLTSSEEQQGLSMCDQSKASCAFARHDWHELTAAGLLDSDV